MRGRESAALGALALLLWAAGAPAQDVSSAEAEVRAAEQAFARSMAQRDLKAFASLLAEDAVFLGREPLRGRDAVVAGWTPYFEGDQAPFSWEPERVVVLASGGLAYSGGPVRDPEGKRVGSFNSTWRREPDGSWRVVLDAGCPPCDCGAAEGR